MPVVILLSCTIAALVWTEIILHENEWSEIFTVKCFFIDEKLVQLVQEVIALM